MRTRFAALLNSPLAAAWLGAIAEPARGGYKRFLAWTVALLPLPRDWPRARAILAPLADRAIDQSAPTDPALLDAVCRAYHLSMPTSHRCSRGSTGTDVDPHADGASHRGARALRRVARRHRRRLALGSIYALRRDQIDTVRRVRSMVRLEGGCLLADDVGTGKTYVALAIAKGWRQPLVIIPASLRSTWEGAMRRAGVPCAMVTHESLSRGTMPAGSFDGIVVDESHRFRPTSNRHATLARLAWRSPLLLLSATPLQNRARELAALIALFIGERAYALEPATLTRWVVRASADIDQTLPTVAPPQWLEPDVNDGEVLEALLALPPPPRAADAGDGGALLLLSLVRAWASSRAALLSTIRRRRRSLVALEQCHAEGRLPTRRELASWRGDEAVQLGFPTLLAAGMTDVEAGAERGQAIEAERDALDIVTRTIERGGDPDAMRVHVLREICDRHRDAAVLAFSQSATTVRAYFAAMRSDSGVGMLTASEARIASGRLSRDELLARFAPLAQGASAPHARERVTLLLATDLLSEGVNLQDASVLVHLDLPWNPARLAQRLGRLRRPGGANQVTTYVMAPPARSGLLLRAEARLREKLAQAERTIGRGLDVLPRLSAGASGQLELPHETVGAASLRTVDAPPLAVAELRGEIHRTLERWRRTSPRRGPSPSHAVVAAVRASLEGWLAVLDDGRLVACLSERPSTSTCSAAATDDVAMVWCALLELSTDNSMPTEVLPPREETSRLALTRWIAADWTRRSCAIDASSVPLRRRALQRLDGAVVKLPRHQRAEGLSLASKLREALARRMTLGAERALSAHGAIAGDLHPLRWLEDAVALVSTPADHSTATQDASRPARARAIVLLCRE